MGCFSLAWDLGVIATSTSTSTGDGIAKLLSSPGRDFLGWVFYSSSSKGQEIRHRGYTILGNFGDSRNVPDAKLDMKRYGMFSKYLWFRNLWKTADKSLQLYLKDGDDRQARNTKDALWRSIFNNAISREDGKDRYDGRIRYSSTRAFLMEHLATNDMVEWSEVRAALDIWLGCLAAMLNISESRRYQI